MKYTLRCYRLRLEPDLPLRNVVAVDSEGKEWSFDSMADLEAWNVRPFENLDKWELEPEGSMGDDLAKNFEFQWKLSEKFGG